MYIRHCLATLCCQAPDSAGAGGQGGSPSPSAGGSPSPSPSPSSSSSPAGVPSGSGGQDPNASPSLSSDRLDQHPRFREVNDKLQKLSWAEQYENPEEVSQATQLYRWFDTDPLGAYEYLTSTLRRNGVLRDAEGQGQAQSRGNGHAQPNYPVDANGRPLPDRYIQETGDRLYSAEQTQRLVDWNMQRFEQRIAPLEASATSTQARADAQRQLQEAETWPYFGDHAEDIFKELQRDKRLSLEGAYRRVVVPKIKQAEREAVIKEMQTKGQASTMNPSSAAPSSTEDLSKLPLKDLFKREMRRRGIGT